MPKFRKGDMLMDIEGYFKLKVKSLDDAGQKYWVKIVWCLHDTKRKGQTSALPYDTSRYFLIVSNYNKIWNKLNV